MMSATSIRMDRGLKRIKDKVLRSYTENLQCAEKDENGAEMADDESLGP